MNRSDLVGLVLVGLLGVAACAENGNEVGSEEGSGGSTGGGTAGNGDNGGAGEDSGGTETGGLGGRSTGGIDGLAGADGGMSGSGGHSTGGASGGSGGHSTGGASGGTGGHSTGGASGGTGGHSTGGASGGTGGQSTGGASGGTGGHSTGGASGGSGGQSTGGLGGAGGEGGTTCMPPTWCNWCGGDEMKDSDGCFAGWLCPNGAEACDAARCLVPEDCGTDEVCGEDGLCWPDSPTSLLLGVFDYDANPCTTDPCLPGEVAVVRNVDITYVITIDGSWVSSREYDWQTEWSFNGLPGQTVTARGVVTYHADLDGRTYREIELTELVYRVFE